MKVWGLCLSLGGALSLVALAAAAEIHRPPLVVASWWITAGVWLTAIGVILMAIHVSQERQRQLRQNLN